MVGFSMYCSAETAHFQYGNVVLHISRDDLRALGIAMHCLADDAERNEPQAETILKKGLVQ